MVSESYTAWRNRLVIMAVNFNSAFQITEVEANVLADWLIDFKHLTTLRLVCFERVNLVPSRRLSFSQFMKAVNFALRMGVLTKDLMNEEGGRTIAEPQWSRRGGRPVADRCE